MLLAELFILVIVGLTLTPIYPVKVAFQNDSLVRDDDPEKKNQIGMILEHSSAPLKILTNKSRNSTGGIGYQRKLDGFLGIYASILGVPADDLGGPSYRITLGVPLFLSQSKDPWTVYKVSASNAYIYARPEVSYLSYLVVNSEDEEHRYKQFGTGLFLGTGYDFRNAWLDFGIGHRFHTKVDGLEPKHGFALQASVGGAF